MAAPHVAQIAGDLALLTFTNPGSCEHKDIPGFSDPVEGRTDDSLFAGKPAARCSMN